MLLYATELQKLDELEPRTFCEPDRLAKSRGPSNGLLINEKCFKKKRSYIEENQVSVKIKT